MQTVVDEINEGIYRISTHIEEVDFTVNQYLVDADEPLLFHLGQRQLFPLVSEAVASVVPLDRLRWLTFGHFEADECGSMNQWLAAAASSELAHGSIGTMISDSDVADRPPRSLGNDESSTLAGSASGGWTPPMSPMAGTPVCSTRRPPARCSAATSSPAWAVVRH